jgi:hypothetical protein
MNYKWHMLPTSLLSDGALHRFSFQWLTQCWVHHCLPHHCTSLSGSLTPSSIRRSARCSDWLHAFPEQFCSLHATLQACQCLQDPVSMCMSLSSLFVRYITHGQHCMQLTLCLPIIPSSTGPHVIMPLAFYHSLKTTSNGLLVTTNFCELHGSTVHCI